MAVAGTYFVQSLEWNTPVILAGLAPGLFSTAILAVNNLRDIDTDRRAGKNTLAVRYGRTFARLEYLVCIVAACFIPAILFLFTQECPILLLSSLVFLFLLPAINTVFTSEDGEQLNNALARTGIALFLYSLIFTVILILQPVALN